MKKKTKLTPSAGAVVAEILSRRITTQPRPEIVAKKLTIFTRGHRHGGKIA